MIIADATVLIALAKTARVGLLRELYGQVAVGPRVKKEVIEGGREIQAAEVTFIEAAFKARWMREVAPSSSEKRLSQGIFKGSRLHEGEAEAIALAASRKMMVLLDDKEARIVAEAMAVQYMGTAGVLLLEAFLRQVLDYGGLEAAVEDLSRVIWLSPDVVAEILRRARETRA
jgi:predicted nucleic acid-binding protein